MASSRSSGSKVSRALLLCLVLAVAGVSSVHVSLAQTPTGTWRSVAPMPTARSSLAAVTVLDGKIYTIGGDANGCDASACARVEVYDPATNTWDCSVGDGASGCSSRHIAPMPTGRVGLAAAVGRDGQIYAIGGCCSGASASDVVEAYDPSINRWHTLAPMPTARANLAAVTGADGRIYTIGGRTTTGGACPPNCARTMEAYDPTTNTWTTLASTSAEHDHGAAASGPDGQIYAIGGCCVHDSGGPFTAAVERYDPATNRWRDVAPLPDARAGLAAAVGKDGQIYAIGGCCDSVGDTTSVEAYDPTTNTWHSVAPMPTAREESAATTGSDGRIYALGGQVNVPNLVFFSTVEVYTPTVSPTATATGATTLTPNASATPINSPPAASTPTASPSPSPSHTPTPSATLQVAAVPGVTQVPGEPGSVVASFTVSFVSTLSGQGEVYFGSGPGCSGLVEVATGDLHPGTTQHTVVVAGNDLPGTVGNNGIIPGATYWFEVVTLTKSGVEMDSNNGQCYSISIPP